MSPRRVGQDILCGPKECGRVSVTLKRLSLLGRQKNRQLNPFTSSFRNAQHRNSVKNVALSRVKVNPWLIRQSGGDGGVWAGRLLESVGGKVSIRLPLFSQAAAGRWPSWVTQMRGGLFNVKPSLSEKAAGHLPLSGPTNTVDAGQISSFPAIFSRRRARLTEKAEWEGIFLPGGRWRVCWGFCVRLGGEYAPRGLNSPSDASRLLQCLAPPACTASAYSNSRLPTITLITAWGQTSPCLSFFAFLCVYFPSRLL